MKPSLSAVPITLLYDMAGIRKKNIIAQNEAIILNKVKLEILLIDGISLIDSKSNNFSTYMTSIGFSMNLRWRWMLGRSGFLYKTLMSILGRSNLSAILHKLLSSMVADINKKGHLKRALRYDQVSDEYGRNLVHPVIGSIT